MSKITIALLFTVFATTLVLAKPPKACEFNGEMFPDCENCQKFYICDPALIARQFECNTVDIYYDVHLKVCAYKQFVQCKDGVRPDYNGCPVPTTLEPSTTTTTLKPKTTTGAFKPKSTTTTLKPRTTTNSKPRTTTPGTLKPRTTTNRKPRTTTPPTRRPSTRRHSTTTF